jgi:GT2 family glycosyltransferase
VRGYEVVVVAYHSGAHLEELLPALPAGVAVAIVDNAQGADGLDELARARPRTRYLHGPDEGFATAANLGARTSEAEVLVFVDPDSRPTGAQLDELVATLDADPGLALVSATTVEPDGRVELGVGGWEPTVGRTLVHALGLHRLLPTRGLYARPRPGRPIELDWLGGACMAIPREVFLRLGGFDESYYVYVEDVEFGRRLREAGLRQVIRTDLLVRHAGAGSGEEKPTMLRMRGAMTMQYLARHHGGAGAA